MGAVGNGPPFSKARWARLRVHGAGSVHGLWRGDQALERVGVATRSSLRSSAETIGDPAALRRGRWCHEAASARLVEVFPRRLACSVRKLGTSNSNSTE